MAATAQFAGSVPQVYDRYFVPLIFEPYAIDLAKRVQKLRPQRVLEVAAGTGVLTRRLAETSSAEIVATDLNQPMLDCAAAHGTARPVTWQLADALQLPFEAASFDVVVCQFGAMFFPDKAKAFAEFRRVLRPGGWLLFSVWDRIETNDFADVIVQCLSARYPDDPPQFMASLPHGYYDIAKIESDLAAGGFPRRPKVTTLPERSRAASPRDPAIAYCQGSPMRAELERHGAARLAEATDLATAAISERFGTGAVDGQIQALVFEVERS